ncbi:hypothetical protein G6F59_018939 [Rhizopus arrhizus]|nr:hypothetical protein G6F59_018939 [Rhizopus arrhizus]
MPLPPITSMPSLTTWRARSVTWYFTIAETTEGFSPRSTAPAVMLRAASIMYVWPPMRASASSTPSNLPTGMRTWLRTRA